MSLHKSDLVATAFECDAPQLLLNGPLTTNQVVIGSSAIGASPDGTLSVNSTLIDENFWYISFNDVIANTVAYYKIALQAPPV